jgi:hypothetical protein
MLQQRAEDQTVTLIEPVITAEMTRATHRDDSRKRVVGLDALASDEDDAVDLGSTRGAKAAAAEAVLGKGTADGDSYYYISRVGARVRRPCGRAPPTLGPSRQGAAAVGLVHGEDDQDVRRSADCGVGDGDEERELFRGDGEEGGRGGEVEEGDRGVGE